MNSLERVLATLSFQKVDRPPVLPVTLLQGAKVLDIDLKSYQNNGQLMAKGQLELLDILGHDGVYGIPHVVQDVLPWGSQLTFFPDGPPSVSKMVINDFSQILNMQIPDPLEHPYLQNTIECLEILNLSVGGKVPIFGACIAPFSLPSMLMGTGPFMSLLLDDDEVRDKYFPALMDMMVSFVSNWANIQLKAGANTIVLADGIASSTVISRQLFERFAFPYIKEVISKIQGPVVYEGVGAVEPFLDLIVDSGAKVAILDYTDNLGKCAEIAKDKIVLMGNLNNIQLRIWSALKTQLETKRALDTMYNYNGFILSTQGPEIPYDTPMDNIKTMIETVKNYR